MLQSETRAQLLASNEFLMQVKDIHWITEKTLTLLHEMHQEFMVAKSVQKWDAQKDTSFDAKLSPAMLDAIKCSVVEAIEGTTMGKKFSEEAPITKSSTLDTKDQLMLGKIAESVCKAVQPLEEQLKETCKQYPELSDLRQSKEDLRENTLATTYPGSDGWLPLDTQASLDKLADQVAKLDARVDAAIKHASHFPKRGDAHLHNSDHRKSFLASRRGSECGDDIVVRQKFDSQGKLDLEWSNTSSGGAHETFADLAFDIKDEYGQDMAVRGAGGDNKAPALKDDSSFSAVFATDTDLSTPFYDPEEFYHKNGCAQHVARHKDFFALQSIMIVINAIYIGVEADWNNSSNIYNAALPYVFLENIFCLYFTWELVVRIMAFETHEACLRDGWIRFDLLLVTAMVLELWVIMPLLLITSGGDDNISVPVGPLRLLRLLKVTRMARMMRAFPELILMVKGLLRSLRAISGAMLLVMIMLYTFAIFEHMLLKGEHELNETLFNELQFDFRTLPRCMWTLGAAGVFMLDGAANVATFLVFSPKTHVAFAGWTFIIFTMITAMTILQMLIGVLCEVVSETNRQHEAARVINVMKQQVMWKLAQFDDGDGKITLQELEQLLNDPECKTVFRNLNINRLFLMEMQKLMFPTKDSAINFKPLTEMMLSCRGDNPATVETIANGLSYLSEEVKSSQRRVERKLEKCFDSLFCRLHQLHQDYGENDEHV